MSSTSRTIRASSPHFGESPGRGPGTRTFENMLPLLERDGKPYRTRERVAELRSTTLEGASPSRCKDERLRVYITNFVLILTHTRHALPSSDGLFIGTDHCALI